MALQRTRRPSLCSGRSLRSLGSPLNARSLDRALKMNGNRQKDTDSQASQGSWLVAPHSHSSQGRCVAIWRDTPEDLCGRDPAASADNDLKNDHVTSRGITSSNPFRIAFSRYQSRWVDLAAYSVRCVQIEESSRSRSRRREAVVEPNRNCELQIGKDDAQSEQKHRHRKGKHQYFGFRPPHLTIKTPRLLSRFLGRHPRSNMALQRTRAARFARIGSPLNARPLGGWRQR
jgi:hypothetical protein